MKQIVGRIEFWIIVFLLVRLIGITNPPLEIGHNWRQVTGLMVARNYIEVDANILYPRIDNNIGETGIIGMEFPIMNYTYFLISELFGYTHWYGRLINLLISSLGLLFFYKLIIHFGFNTKTAFTSTIFLAASIWFTFSRKMMPDTFCISLVIISLFYGIKYLDNKKACYILSFILISSIAVLSKIPAGIYFVVLIPLLLNSKCNLKPRIILAVSLFIPFSLTFYWYFVWNPHLANEFGNWYNIGQPFVKGFTEIIENSGKTLENFYFNSFSGYLVFILFIIGLVAICIKKEKKIILMFLLFLSVFMVYIFKSGFYFHHHNYYIIPFVPIMALIAGYAAALVKTKWIYFTIILLGVGESIANQQHDLFIKNSEKYKMSLEPIMDKISNKNDLVLINGNENPQLIYLSHRKGWNCSDKQLHDSFFLMDVIAKGCKYIIINRHTQKELKLKYKCVFENDDFLIYQTSTVAKH